MARDRLVRTRRNDEDGNDRVGCRGRRFKFDSPTERFRGIARPLSHRRPPPVMTGATPPTRNVSEGTRLPHYVVTMGRDDLKQSGERDPAAADEDGSGNNNNPAPSRTLRKSNPSHPLTHATLLPSPYCPRSPKLPLADPPPLLKCEPWRRSGHARSSNRLCPPSRQYTRARKPGPADKGIHQLRLAATWDLVVRTRGIDIVVLRKCASKRLRIEYGNVHLAPFGLRSGTNSNQRRAGVEEGVWTDLLAGEAEAGTISGCGR